MNIVRPLLVERLTGLTRIACLTFCRGIQTVDGLGEDTGTGGFTYSARTAKQVSVCQFLAGNGIFKGSSQCALSDHRIESGGTVFACRYNIVLHMVVFMIILMFVPTKVHKISVSTPASRSKFISLSRELLYLVL